MSNRITRLKVSNFRSIRGTIDVNLDAPVVLIHGPNGSGKTSILSAIELALTGQVSSFERVGAKKLSDLVHRNENEATIEIERSAREKVAKSSGSIKITTGSQKGQPLLEGLESRFFSERCFLAQSALGRLLEIYEDEDARDSASPLTKFVQELLRLDYLDNVVDGLSHLRDLRSLKKQVPEVADADNLRKSLAAKIEELETVVANAEVEVDATKATLSELLGDPQVGPRLGPDEQIAALESDTSYREEGRRLSILTRELEAALKVLESTSGSQDADASRLASQELQVREQELALWAAQSKPAVTRAMESAALLLKNLPSVESAGYASAYLSTVQVVAGELKRLQAIAAQDQINQSKLAQAKEAAEKAEARVRGLDEQLSGLAASSGELAAVLIQLLPLIESDVCPVCERDFKEHSTTPLNAHVAEHVAQMAQSARRMQEVVTERNNAVRTRDTAKREIENLTGQVQSATALSELRVNLAQFEELREQLASIVNVVSVGDERTAQHRAASAKLAKLSQNEQALTGVRQTAEAFPSQIGVRPAGEGETTQAVLERCLLALRQRLAALDKQRESQTIALEAAKLLKVRLQSLEKAKRSAAECKAMKDAVDHAWAKSDQTRKEGRLLADHAREVRTNIVRRVFNTSLNTVWRDLFIRLAPEEQFIPAFALPTDNDGPVEARLQTWYRGTEEAGNPRAMLSAGNLNTAALTLFLALHLSVKPELPWLVIDDPVQSMDEIHIAQFAALLRTLSRQAHRQTIIAVHEKSLFDYLALELSPAHESDRLVTLELSRTADGTTSHNYDMKTWKRESVLQVARTG